MLLGCFHLQLRMMLRFGFFFSSRRRHTRWTGDWSSDVCSSDLASYVRPRLNDESAAAVVMTGGSGARSEERRVGKSVDLGGRRIIKKKKEKIYNKQLKKRRKKRKRDLRDDRTITN